MVFSARTHWLGVSMLWLSEIASFNSGCISCWQRLLSEQICPWDTLACCWDVQKQNKQIKHFHWKLNCFNTQPTTILNKNSNLTISVWEQQLMIIMIALKGDNAVECPSFKRFCPGRVLCLNTRRHIVCSQGDFLSFETFYNRVARALFRDCKDNRSTVSEVFVLQHYGLVFSFIAGVIGDRLGIWFSVLIRQDFSTSRKKKRKKIMHQTLFGICWFSPTLEGMFFLFFKGVLLVCGLALSSVLPPLPPNYYYGMVVCLCAEKFSPHRCY